MEAWNVWFGMCVQADKLIRELQSNNRLLKSELQATTTSFKQALHVAQTMLDTGVPPPPSFLSPTRFPAARAAIVQTFLCSFIHVCICSFFALLSGLLAHSLTHPPTHPPTHAFAPPPLAPSLPCLLSFCLSACQAPFL